MCPFSKTANTATINIDSLNSEVRTFVVRYEQGSRQASQLVSSEALQVREVVVRQSGKTEEAIRAHVTRTSAKFERKLDYQIEQAGIEQLRERVLKSLKYPGMNERANQVETAHASTFRWLFVDNDVGNGSEIYPSSSPMPFWNSFTDWLRSDLSLYWIMGKPGSGKSTLAKFILSEPCTKSALDKWRSGPIIASHYFWRPGSLLQRSIKGMLCSITYQLVFSMQNALGYVSTSVAGINRKDADTDWSIPELQRLCLGLIRYCGKPLCLFIDGLDECGPEDSHQKLLEVLEEIKLPNVKLVVLSRNEPIFERRFRHEPQLRVQDLTAGDLRTYAMDMLPRQIRDDVCNDLVKKAEGVFLWLVLAVQSINRGFSNGDSLPDLHRRIRRLPKGLNDLYKDMWKRLNDDSDIYRESAALYFKLIIADQQKQMRPKRRSSGLIPRHRNTGLTPLEMMLASYTTDHHAFAKEPLVSASQLLKDCREFHERVKVRCAGLLALYGVPHQQPLEKRWGGTQMELLEYADKWVRFDFIHRSAHDFLIDTVEGQNILRHDRSSPRDIQIRCMGANLRAIELLDMILGDAAHLWYDFNLNWQHLEDYLEDLSSIENCGNGAARELVSRCYKLYRSPSLILHQRYTRPARIAAFFGAAAKYSNLNHHCTSIVEKQLVGSAIRSAILLSVATTDHGNNTLRLVRWLLSLPDVDVNLKCPLVCNTDFFAQMPLKDISLGPLDHIKESPFARLLGSGLIGLDWKRAGATRHRYKFLGLVSDFAFQGADFRSTLFSFYATDLKTRRQRLGRQEVFPRFFQIPSVAASQWADRHYTDDDILCVVALQATTVIQKMLASLPMTSTGHNRISEDEYSPSEDEYSASVLEKALHSLFQKCQEYGSEANDRVIGFLQPSGNFTNVPFRQVSEQDSAQIMEMIWAWFFDDKFHVDNVEARWREVAARSPFSSISFRDYMSDMGCFDGPAAHKLLSEYQQGIVTSLAAHIFEFWQ